MPKEAYFASQVRADFMAMGWFFHKIPDTPSIKEVRFSPVKLFDAFVLNRGMFSAIEFKMVKGTSFPFSQVRDSQVQALLEIEKAGGVSYLFLNHRHNGNAVIVWRIKKYIELRNIWTQLGRKSIPLKTYASAWTILERIKKPARWDLQPIVEEIENEYGR